MSPKDAIASRKVGVVILGMTLVTGVAIACEWIDPLVGLYPTFGGLILGLVTVYLTGNVAQKALVKKDPQ